MASEVTPTDPVTVDPEEAIKALATHHLQRMQEIGNDGRTATQLGCVAVLGMISRNVGLRNAVYDKALAAIASTDPTV